MKIGIYKNEDVDLSKAQEILGRYRDDKGSLIPVLQDIQDIYGCVPEDVSCLIAEELSIPESQVFGVLTFYAQFRLQPRGKYIIRVCRGTACHVSGAEILSGEVKDVLGLKGEDEGTTTDGLFSFEEVACIGACGLAPVMIIDEQAFGKLTPSKVGKIIKGVREKEL